MPVLTDLRRIRIAPSPADILTDAITGFVQPQVLAAEIAYGRKSYERNFLSSDGEQSASILGEPVASLALEMDARGFGTPAGPAVAAKDGEAGLLLKSIFGAQALDTGDTGAAGGTVTVPKLATAGRLDAPGKLIGYVDPGTGRYSVRQVRSVAGLDATVCRAFPFLTGGSGASLYGAARYTRALYGHQHVWADVEGVDPSGAAGNWHKFLRGGLGTFELAGGSANEQMRFKFDLQFADFADSDGVVLTPPALAVDLPVASVFARSSRFWVDAAEQKVASFALSYQNDVQPRPYTGGPGGLNGFFVRGVKLGFTFTAFWNDGCAALEAKYRARTSFDLLLEMTQGGPGNSIVIVAPTVEIADVKPTSVNGLDAREFTCRILRTPLAGVPSFTFALC